MNKPHESNAARLLESGKKTISESKTNQKRTNKIDKTPEDKPANTRGKDKNEQIQKPLKDKSIVFEFRKSSFDSPVKRTVMYNDNYDIKINLIAKLNNIKKDEIVNQIFEYFFNNYKIEI